MKRKVHLEQGSSATRAGLVAAAIRVIRRMGTRKLTLEATAREAGVSKGGLLYHFPTKEALVGALIASGFDAFDQAIQQRRKQGLDWLQAYADASLSPGELDDMGAALLGALVENPALLEPAQNYYRQWYAQARTCGGVGGVLALLVLDGLFIHQTLGLERVISHDELTIGLKSLVGRSAGGASCCA